ncbi:hypothetical protein F7725_000174 [Dissostichus mawsoni]|uniref:protein kinase C n=1 Tax=Dissostichus mawsoni TaxID=36200 RepID=A0A7J5ZFZ2_DISMA|nr:hypothetical protein F7725_000174 [Dissostichus mawsoni]
MHMLAPNGSIMELDSEFVKIKAHYSGDMLIADLAATLTFVELCEEVRMLCSVAKQQPITLKWIDDEVFPSIPERPGMPCPGEDNEEELIPKKGATSVVWKWFGYKRSDIEQTTVLCKVCRKSIAAKHGNTTNLFQHLRQRHAVEWQECVALRDADASSSHKVPAKKQVTLAEAFSSVIPYDKKGPRWQAITDAVTHYIAKDMVPIYTPEEQCLEMSQALINVLSWRDLAVPPCSPAQTPHTCHSATAAVPLLFTPPNMAGLCALAFASGDISHQPLTMLLLYNRFLSLLESIYRRGARRWRKLYRVNGHLFQAKRFNRKAYCGHCAERIWGLGRQGYKCINCKLLVHKRCHRLIPQTCQRLMDPVMPSQEPPSDAKSEEVDLPPDDTEDTDGIPFLPHNCSVDKAEDADTEDIKAVVDGIDGIKLSPGLTLGLGDFDLIRVIGRGSYAKVLLVRLKKNKQDIDWVQTEKHVFEQASTNPFLVGLHSCFQTESRLFLVIEYVNGGDMMFHMQRQRKLPEEHARPSRTGQKHLFVHFSLHRFYAAEICIALNFLHEKGIIYRDLKLDNVLLDHEGHIKLTDYGMCKEGIRPGDTTSTFCGTPNYIAPEILRGEDYGEFQRDWWALGVLMFEMMAGRSPFDIITDNPDMNTEEYLFQVILEKPIRIPRSLSVKAASVLKGFLNKLFWSQQDPKERLGCQVETGYTDIKSHTFFRSIDWDQLEKKEMTPPFKPQITDDYGLENFDTQFTNEPVQLTPDDEGVCMKESSSPPPPPGCPSCRLSQTQSQANSERRGGEEEEEEEERRRGGGRRRRRRRRRRREEEEEEEGGGGGGGEGEGEGHQVGLSLWTLKTKTLDFKNIP